MTRCGYIGLVGRPNSGKSTLLNAVIGQKIVGVSAKPQTTRNKVLGILTEGEDQLLFLDTPGMHRSQGKKINSLMNKEAWSVLVDADFVCYMIDVNEGWHPEDTDFLTRILTSNAAPLVLMITKIDSLKVDLMTAKAKAIESAFEALVKALPDPDHPHRIASESPIYMSAKRPDSVKYFREVAAAYIPESPWFYPEDDLTDRSQKFVSSELIRENVFRLLGQELPYHAAVTVNQLEDKGDIVVIHANIIVARTSQKGMVVGRGGAKIKEIGAASRMSLEKHFDKKVFLDLQVSVDEDWADRDSLISEYAHLERPK